jgi:hypothetical protein
MMEADLVEVGSLEVKVAAEDLIHAGQVDVGVDPGEHLAQVGHLHLLRVPGPDCRRPTNRQAQLEARAHARVGFVFRQGLQIGVGIVGVEERMSGDHGEFRPPCPGTVPVEPEPHRHAAGAQPESAVQEQRASDRLLEVHVREGLIGEIV